MYRQHPYSGYSASQGRRTDSPPGPGPDRTRPPAERGYGRGRGGGPPRRGGGGGAPGAMSFSSYEPPYPGPALDNPYAEDAYNFRNGAREEYNQFESHSDAPRGGRLPRNNENSKAHDPLIEERLQRERPCRTLFIRNIKYETDSNEFRHRFEEFGEIKTFFDLISHRGMVFCTYYDMRAAERAKERLQGTELAGRPIDVHYSLPRDDQKNELNQGIITVTLIDSPSRGPIDDMELRRKLTTFGDVKSIQSNGGRSDSRTVEFYDLRAAEEAHEKLRHQTLQDGVMETDWVFLGDQIIPPGPAMQERARMEKGGNTNVRGGRGRGGRGRGGRGGFDDRRGRDWEEEDYYNRDRGRMSPGRYEDRYRARSPPPRARSNGDLSADKDKLEQAKKVQDLLAALKQTGTSSAPAPAAPPASQPMYYPPAAGGVPSYGLPPNMAHLGAIFAQLPPHQAAAAAAAIQQLQNPPTYGAPPPPPSLVPPMPPPSALFGASQPPYPFPPASQSTASANSNFPNPNLYALLDQQKSSQGGPPPNSAPPDTARFNYGAGAPNPPAASSTSTQAPSIQDIMALLKNSS